MNEEATKLKIFYNSGQVLFLFLQSPKYCYKVLAHQYSYFYLTYFKKCAKSHQILLRYNETPV